MVISSVLIVYTETRQCMYGVADTFRQGTGGVVGERSAQQVLLRSNITKRPMNPLKRSALPVRTWQGCSYAAHKHLRGPSQNVPRMNWSCTKVLARDVNLFFFHLLFSFFSFLSLFFLYGWKTGYWHLYHKTFLHLPPPPPPPISDFWLSGILMANYKSSTSSLGKRCCISDTGPALDNVSRNICSSGAG